MKFELPSNISSVEFQKWEPSGRLRTDFARITDPRKIQKITSWLRQEMEEIGFTTDHQAPRYLLRVSGNGTDDVAVEMEVVYDAILIEDLCFWPRSSSHSMHLWNILEDASTDMPRLQIQKSRGAHFVLTPVPEGD